MSKRRHNFETKRFKEKSLFIFHARIALKSLILLFVRLIARGARIGKTHTHTHTHIHTHTDRQTDRQDKYCNPRACAPRVNYACTINNNCVDKPCAVNLFKRSRVRTDVLKVYYGCVLPGMLIIANEAILCELRP